MVISKVKLKIFSPKCVLTPKDHFERHLYFPHFRGGVREVWKKSTLFIFFFEGFPKDWVHKWHLTPYKNFQRHPSETSNWGVPSVAGLKILRITQVSVKASSITNSLKNLKHFFEKDELKSIAKPKCLLYCYKMCLFIKTAVNLTTLQMFIN